MRWPERGHLLREDVLLESGGEHPGRRGLGPPLPESRGATTDFRLPRSRCSCPKCLLPALPGPLPAERGDQGLLTSHPNSTPAGGVPGNQMRDSENDAESEPELLVGVSTRRAFTKCQMNPVRFILRHVGAHLSLGSNPDHVLALAH